MQPLLNYGKERKLNLTNSQFQVRHLKSLIYEKNET